MSRVDRDLLMLRILIALFLCQYVDLVSAQDGFLSVDCGAASDYTDDATGISWVTDDRYTATGVNVGNINDSSFKQGESLRYFPNPRKKYCYSIPVRPDNTYLVRAGFFYGNYDKLKKPPVFGLTIETNFWTNVSFSTSSGNAQEIIVRTTRNILDVCLVRFQDTPFISALELRPLSNTMYSKVQDSCFLSRLIRVNCGVDPSTPRVRYPFDPFDRLWESSDPPSSKGDFKRVSNNNTNFVPGSAVDAPPAAVMSSAWVSNGTRSMSFTYTGLVSPNQSFYVALFFAEVQDAEILPNATRIFNILVNDELFSGPLNLTAVDHNAVLEASRPGLPLKESTNFTLVPTPESSLGPLVNAIEIYSVSDKFDDATDQQDARALSALKNTFNLRDWAGDPCLPEPWDWVSCSSQIPPRINQLNLSHMSLSGSIPPEITKLRELTDLMLNGNYLTGRIPDFSQLTHLRRLHLENNKLEGPIPESLANLAGLKELFVDHNNLSLPVPQAILDKAKKGLLNYSGPGNPCECSSGTATCSCPSEGANAEKEESSGRIWGAVTGAMLSLLALGLASITISRYYKRKSAPVASMRGTLPCLEGGERENSGRLLSMRTTPRASPDIHPQLLFSIRELKIATSNFNRLLGKGRFGPVYYGKLVNEQEIAVKVLELRDNQGRRDLSSEIELISRTRHRNLVRFIGYCREPDKEYLIYEYMVEGTLRDHLVGPLAKRSPLNWKTRLDIALNAARGLEYLHTSAKATHRDIKSSNVLLNVKLTAKLGDFGLSEISSNRKANLSHVAQIARTNACYLDPEYYGLQQWTQKSDIYSFGVVLLEIICGREPINDNLPEPQRNIIEWVRPVVQAPNNVKSIVDPKLDGVYNSSAMWKVVRIANQCLEPRSADRPTVSQVVQDLMVALDMDSGIFHGLTDLSSDSSMERSVKLPLTLKSSQYNFRTGRTCFTGTAAESSGHLTPLQMELLEASAEHDLFSLSQSHDLFSLSQTHFQPQSHNSS